MLNILPPQQKNLIQKEYSTRRIVVALGLLTTVFIISLTLLLPSYFITQVRAKIVREELELTKRTLDDKLPPADVMLELSAAAKHAQAFKPLRDQASVFELVKIFEGKPSSIKISGISFMYNTEGGSLIAVRGRAADRESLKAFGRALESRVEFVSVDLPISNFVKERDIDFAMTITLR